MTNYELGQNDKTVIRAGRTAFNLGVILANNPYRKNPRFSRLWAIGFKQARKTDDSRKLANGKYKQYYEPLVEFPTCEKCLSKVSAQANSESSYCIRCGDYYKHTEFEYEDTKKENKRK